MDGSQEKRARELVADLEEAGLNCGLLVMQGTVVLRCPGAPYVDSPIMKFGEADLHNAVALELLEKRKVTGSYEWEWYALKKEKAK